MLLVDESRSRQDWFRLRASSTGIRWANAPDEEGGSRGPIQYLGVRL